MSFECAKSPAEEKFNTALRRLIKNEPFFAAVSRNITKRESKNIPTACVFIDKISCNLFMEYNPDFLLALPDEVVYLVVLHELYHTTLGHITTRQRSLTDDDKKLWNFATDAAINSILCSGNKGEGAVDPTKMVCDALKGPIIPGFGELEDVPPHKASEWYLAYFKKDADKWNKMQEGSDHSGWGDQSEACDKTVDISNAKLREVMSRAAEECNKKDSWGNIPAEMQAAIKRFIAGPPLDWRAILKFLVQKSVKAGKKHSIKRLNKRFPMLFPGTKNEHSANICVMIDQSGSVSDKLLGLLGGQLNVLSDICTFTLINFDCSVDESSKFVWRRGQKLETIKRTRCGGTDFDAPTQWVNEHGGFDALLIVTDMEAPKPSFCKVQRFWLTHEGYHHCFETDEMVVCVPKFELEND